MTALAPACRVLHCSVVARLDAVRRARSDERREREADASRTARANGASLLRFGRT
jgi:hypothetical protein